MDHENTQLHLVPGGLNDGTCTADVEHQNTTKENPNLCATDGDLFGISLHANVSAARNQYDRHGTSKCPSVSENKIGQYPKLQKIPRSVSESPKKKYKDNIQYATTDLRFVAGAYGDLTIEKCMQFASLAISKLAHKSYLKLIKELKNPNSTNVKVLVDEETVVHQKSR